MSQNTLGSTVKTDGIESDPFAFLTVVNINEHKENPAVRQLTDYFLLKTKLKPEFHAKLKHLFNPPLDGKDTSQTGLILSERLINMPTEVAPPMYKMLMDEMNWAIQDVSLLRELKMACRFESS